MSRLFNYRKNQQKLKLKKMDHYLTQKIYESEYNCFLKNCQLYVFANVFWEDKFDELDKIKIFWLRVATRCQVLHFGNIRIDLAENFNRK